MTKKEFLDELRRQLKHNGVEDIDDVVSEYEDHFEFKSEEGYTEEEIARKLSSPKEIAEEYAPSKQTVNKYEKGVCVTGLAFLSIPLAMIYALMWCSVIVVGAFSVACLVAGFCLVTTINVAGLIPAMPYFSGLLCGIALFWLSVLSAVGTYYMFMYVKQWGKVYVKWCKNTANKRKYPSESKHPEISRKTSSVLKLVAIIGLVCFVSAFVIGYVSLCVSAGSFEFWHVFNWFK